MVPGEPIMKVNTNIKVGPLSAKIKEGQTRGLKIKTGIKAGPTCSTCIKPT
jgi:hypothetical protein